MISFWFNNLNIVYQEWSTCGSRHCARLALINKLMFLDRLSQIFLHLGIVFFCEVLKIWLHWYKSNIPNNYVRWSTVKFERYFDFSYFSCRIKRFVMCHMSITELCTIYTNSIYFIYYLTLLSTKSLMIWKLLAPFLIYT